MLFCKVTKSERKNRKLKIENRIYVWPPFPDSPLFNGRQLECAPEIEKLLCCISTSRCLGARQCE